jgi:hypothetical protein
LGADHNGGTNDYSRENTEEQYGLQGDVQMQYLSIGIYVLYLFPAALILVASIILQDKIRSRLTTLLIMGQTGVLIGGVISLVLQILLIAGAIPIPLLAKLMVVPSVISVVGGLVFGFGLLAVARDMGARNMEA